MRAILLFVIAIFCAGHPTFAETRTAKDMQKECRVALGVLQKSVEPTVENALVLLLAGARF
jgi:hypothetical protein